MGILKHIGKIVHAGYHTGYGIVGKGIHEIIDVAIMGVKGRFVDLCLCYDIGYRDLFDRLFASHAKKGVGDGFFVFCTRISIEILLCIAEKQRIGQKALLNQRYGVYLLIVLPFVLSL